MPGRPPPVITGEPVSAHAFRERPAYNSRAPHRSADGTGPSPTTTRPATRLSVVRQSNRELVSERANRGSFILTSNRSPKDWYELFPNPVVAESVLDRLINSSFHVHMEGKSYRPRRRPGRSEDLVKGGGKG